MSKAYFARWITISLLASALTTYLNSQDIRTPEYTYTVALIVGLGIGMLVLVTLDILAIKPED